MSGMTNSPRLWWECNNSHNSRWDVNLVMKQRSRVKVTEERAKWVIVHSDNIIICQTWSADTQDYVQISDILHPPVVVVVVHSCCISPHSECCSVVCWWCNQPPRSSSEWCLHGRCPRCWRRLVALSWRWEDELVPNVNLMGVCLYVSLWRVKNCSPHETQKS